MEVGGLVGFSRLKKKLAQSRGHVDILLILLTDL